MRGKQIIAQTAKGSAFSCGGGGGGVCWCQKVGPAEIHHRGARKKTAWREGLAGRAGKKKAYCHESSGTALLKKPGKAAAGTCEGE